MKKTCLTIIASIVFLVQACGSSGGAGGGSTAVSSGATVTTFAGTAGVSGTTDGTGAAAKFNHPIGIAFDGSGNLFVTDSLNGSIRRVTPVGVVTSGGTLGAYTLPYGIAVDGSINLYFAEGSVIRKLNTSTMVLTTLAGTAGQFGATDGTGAAARFVQPVGVAVDVLGNVYVSDGANNTIRKITSAGVVTTLAGTANATGFADGTGAAARFNQPQGIALDSLGNLYVADATNNTIRKITAGGVVTTIAGSAAASGSVDGVGTAALFKTPLAIAVDSLGNLYVADSGNCIIRKITAAGVVTTIAGTLGVNGSADGAGSVASFHDLYGIAVDSSGIIYVSDRNNDTIRKITQ